MRITQSRLIEIASTSVGKARDRTGDASIQLSSGIRVAKPSDDAAAWATGMAAKAALTMNATHEKTIDRARDRVGQADAALAEVHGNLLDAPRSRGAAGERHVHRRGSNRGRGPHPRDARRRARVAERAHRRR